MQSFKEQLTAYLDIVEENDREIARYEELESSGKATAEKLNEIKQEIISRTNAEVKEKAIIKSEISRLQLTVQRQVMTYRYIDRLDWNTVTKIMYHGAADYDINIDKYKRKVFKIHSKAIMNIDKLHNRK